MTKGCGRFMPLPDTGRGGNTIWTCAVCQATRSRREKFLELEGCQR